MPKCPNCNERVGKDEAICSNCGFNVEQPTEVLSMEDKSASPTGDLPDGSQEQEKTSDKEEATPEETQKKQLTKRPVFWVLLTTGILIALLVAGGIGGYFYLKSKSESNYKTKVKSLWVDILAKCNSLDNTLDEVTGEFDLPMFANELAETENTIAEARTEAVNVEPPKEKEEEFQNFLTALDDLSDYIIKAKIIANKDPLKIADKSLTLLKKQAEKAKLSTDNVVSEISFIEKKIPENIFKIDATLKPIIRDAKDATKRKKERQSAVRAESEKKAAQQTVISFMQAKINNDTAEMRRYLTDAFEKSFDPEAEKGDFDPVDFKITKTTPRDSTYIILGEETNRSWEGESFKTRYEFTVIKEANSWLIDRRKNLP